MCRKKFALVLGLICWFVLSVGISIAVDLESIQGAWLFDEDKGAEVLDSSGKGHNGAVVGAAKWVNGKYGSALEFSGGKASIPHADEFTTPTFTLMAWVNIPKPTASWQVIVGKDGWPNRNYLLAIVQNQNLVHFAFCKAGQQDVGNFNSINGVADGQWHHVAGTYDLKVRKIYIDGKLDNQAPSSEKPSESNVAVEIGVNLTGTIDEVLVANQAFPEEDIKSAMDNGLEKLLGGSAVSKLDKLTVTWGNVKQIEK